MPSTRRTTTYEVSKRSQVSMLCHLGLSHTYFQIHNNTSQDDLTELRFVTLYMSVLTNLHHIKYQQFPTKQRFVQNKC